MEPEQADDGYLPSPSALGSQKKVPGREGQGTEEAAAPALLSANARKLWLTSTKRLRHGGPNTQQVMTLTPADRWGASLWWGGPNGQIWEV
ncbi:unnamed protein product [Arctogadus glacialis]